MVEPSDYNQSQSHNQSHNYYYRRLSNTSSSQLYGSCPQLQHESTSCCHAPQSGQEQRGEQGEQQEQRPYSSLLRHRLQHSPAATVLCNKCAL